MNKSAIQKNLLSNFPFTPTADQEMLIDKVSEFICDDSERKVLF